MAALAFGLGVLVAVVLGLRNTGDDAPGTQRRTATGATAAPAGPPSGEDPALLASRLTGPDLVAQLFLVGVRGQDADAAVKRRLRSRLWGGVALGRANFSSPRQLTALTAEIDRNVRVAGPVGPLIAARQLGGEGSAFAGLPPVAPIAQAAAGRPVVARTQARRAGRALRAAGVNTTLAPNADVATAGGPSDERSFGEDPRRVAAFVTAALQGYREAGTVAVPGPFPGAGAASQDPGLGPASVGLSLPELRERDLVPFVAAARVAPAIQVSNAVYAAYDGATPAALLPAIAGGLLRRELRFGGVIVTDDLVATAEIAGLDPGRAALAALHAGADLLYVPGGPREQEAAYAAVLRAYQQGRLATARLRASATRVLALKRAYRLLGPPRP